MAEQRAGSRGPNLDMDIRDTRDETMKGTETKAAFKTTEFLVFVAAVVLVLIAGLIMDGFNATETWRYFTFLAIGYMISRGLAKSGSRNPRAGDE